MATRKLLKTVVRTLLGRLPYPWGLGGRRSVVSFGVHILAWIPTLKRDSTSHGEIVNIGRAREFANLPRLVTRGSALGFTKQAG